MKYLISGGVKSGKSYHALQLARTHFSVPVSFIATAEIVDDEMRDRIEKHKQERCKEDGTEEFLTIEEPLELHNAVKQAGSALVIDCIPMWINNLVYYKRTDEFTFLLDSLFAALPDNWIMVTNETGLGTIPFDAETRLFNRLLAEANRLIAREAEHLDFMVCGIPLQVK